MDAVETPKPHPDHPTAEIIYNASTQKHTFTSHDDKLEYEFDPTMRAWFPVLTPALLRAHGQAYSVKGVDDTIPDRPLKRKKPAGDKPVKPKDDIVNTAVYVTNLPSDTTAAELAVLFAKGGVMLIDPLTELPRIKVYTDTQGKCKGDALVIYLRPESVDIAIALLDDVQLRQGATTRIGVQPAMFSEKRTKQTQSQDAEQVGKGVKRRNGKAIQKLRSKLEWAETDAVPASGAAAKHLKTVVLGGMFTIDELASDPSLLIDLKADVRLECEGLGSVQSVALYDVFTFNPA